MKLLYRLLPIVFLLLSCFKSNAQLPTKCFEIQSILVDACGSPEGENEQARILTGPNPISLASLTVSWPNNSFNGWCQNATSAAKVDSLNQTILRCGWILEPPAGVIPPYKQVVFFTSLNMLVSFNSFANLTDTIYAVFQCAGNTAGHFANYQSGVGIRTTTFSYTGGCSDVASYDRSQLVRQNGTIGAQDGGGVLFDFAGNPTYYNNGCQAAIPITTVFAGNDTAICVNADSFQLKGRLENVKSQKWLTTGSGTFSQSDSATTFYRLSPTDVLPISFYLKGNISCNDSIFDTLVVSRIPNTINAGTDAAVCAGSSIIVFATGGSGYNWSPAATVSNPNGATPTLSPAATTDYILTGTHGPGCIGSDTIRITVNPQDTILANFTDTTICLGQSVQILLSGISSVVFTPSTGLSCSSCLNPIATPSMTTVYQPKSSATCFDTKTITINVDVPTPISVPVSACGSATYKGVTYTASATILDTLKNVRGCDSLLITANLTILPLIRDTVRLCIVNGQSYTAGGAAQTTTGFYNDTLPSSIGCDTVRVTDLVVVNTAVNNNALSGCQSVTFNGQTYTSSTVVRDTVFSSRGCPQTITNTTITISTTYVYGNRAVCILAGQSYFVGGANQTNSGIYRDTIALPSGCDSVTITLLQVINTTTTNNQLSGCNQVTFKGQNYTSSTVVRDTIKSALGCDSVFVNTAITVNTNNVTTNNEVCILKGQSYHAGGANQTLSGTYIDTFKRATGCDSIINTRLQVIDTIRNIVNVPTACGAVTFNGTTYTASTVLTSKILSRLGCDSVYNVVNITVNQLPATVNQEACINPGQSFAVGTKSYTVSGNYIDTLIAGNGCDSIVRTSLALITPTANTSTVDGCDTVRFGGAIYTANTTLNNTILSAQGCDSIFSTVQIRVHPTYSYTITADKPMPLEVGESVTLSSNFNGTSPYYNWKPNQFITSGNNQPTITVSPTSDIVYTMDYFVADSTCKLLDTFRVTVKQLDPKFELPNAFSPNNDGINDLFRVLMQPGLELKAFRVFNRWGELVFEEKETSFGWNGMYKDVAQPVGVYVYYVEVKNLSTGKTNTRSGNVTLLR